MQVAYIFYEMRCGSVLHGRKFCFSAWLQRGLAAAQQCCGSKCWQVSLLAAATGLHCLSQQILLLLPWPSAISSRWGHSDTIGVAVASAAAVLTVLTSAMLPLLLLTLRQYVSSNSLKRRRQQQQVALDIKRVNHSE